MKEVAEILKVDERTVINYIKEGKLDCIKFSSRCTRISEEQLNNFIKEHEAKI